MRSRLLEYLEASTDPSMIYSKDEPVGELGADTTLLQSPLPQQRAIEGESVDKIGDYNIDRNAPGNDLLKQKRHWNFMAENARMKYPGLGGRNGQQL
jgi:hypothetical protein